MAHDELEQGQLNADQTSPLPAGWIETTLKDVAVMRLGKMLDAAKQSMGRQQPYLRNINVRWFDFHLDGLETMAFDAREEAEFELRPGDLLICEGGEPGRCAIWTEMRSRIKFQKAIHRVRLPDSIDPKWVMYDLRRASLDGSLEKYFTGSTIKHLTGVGLARYRLRFPPLAEQRRIVKRIEKILARVAAARDRLVKTYALLKRFRQSVLTAACSGRLTASWRQTEDHNDGLPVGWSWTSVGDVVPKGSMFDGPFGSNLKSSDYTAVGVRVIRLENIGKLAFKNLKRTYISQEKFASLLKHQVNAGDIIFASFISDEVRACVLPQLDSVAIAKADCFCLRPDSQKVNRQFLTLQLVSQESHDALVGEIHGATRPRINLTQLRSLRLRLCPLSEQGEIVRQVDALFALSDKIEARVAAASARAEKLIQSILAKAFRGELVPTEHALQQANRAQQMADGMAVLQVLALLYTWKASPDRRTFELGMILIQHGVLRARVLKSDRISTVSAVNVTTPQMETLDELISELIGSGILQLEQRKVSQLVKLGANAPSEASLVGTSVGKDVFAQAQEAVKAVESLKQLGQSLDQYATAEEYDAIEIAIS